MDRRTILKGGLALAVAAPFPTRAGTTQMSTLYEDLLQKVLDASPQTASLFSLDSGRNAGLKYRLTEKDDAHRLDLYQPLAEAAPMLAAVRGGSLSPRQLVWLETVRWAADSARTMAAFPYNRVQDSYLFPVPYALSQLTGAYASVPDLLADQHTIETAADCDAYLSRLAALPATLDQENAGANANAALGVVPPDFICESTLAQLGRLAKERGQRPDSFARWSTALAPKISRVTGSDEPWRSSTARLPRRSRDRRKR